jgi:dTDP-4-dehydrorhamnose reductase
VSSDGGVLLVSPDGMLGRAWKELLVARGAPHDELVYPAFDMTKQEQVERAVGAHHRVVVNCAAFTDVDGAEKREAEAHLVNGTAVGYLAERCRQVGATLVHYSTDYVFDGNATAPYRVDAPHDPVNAYGRSKADGERRVFESGVRNLVVRTSWLYAPWANNFVRTIARLSRERPEIRVVNDQRGRPTSSEQLALGTFELLEHGAAAPAQDGVFHVTDGGECTWFEFATRIVATTNPTCRVLPCTTAEFPRPAKRPAYSVLDLEKCERLLGPRPAWTECVDAVASRLEA